MAVRLPVDQLEELWPSELRGARIGALLHGASVSSELIHTLDIVERLNGGVFTLTSLFGPQHGFYGHTQDNMVEWSGFRHPRLGVPVFSLYGEHRESTAEMLSHIDVLFVDLQDVGARYYTFVWTLYLCMRACETAGVAVVVADRPNPINGVTIEGTALDAKYRSFVGMHPIPVRHGKTIGELATQFRAEAFPRCQLKVLPMENWKREMWWDQTGLAWVMPSPNMPSLETATVYPGMCLLEGTNVSEGRGTTRPFEIFGAPWIEPRDFCTALNRLGLPGVVFREVFFQPTCNKFAGELCCGAQLHVLDRDVFEPFRTGVAIINEIRRRYLEQFQWKPPPYEYEYEKLPIEILIGAPVENFFPSL